MWEKPQSVRKNIRFIKEKKDQQLFQWVSSTVCFSRPCAKYFSREGTIDVFLKHKKLKLLAVTISGAILKIILWKRVPFKVNYHVIQERFAQAYKKIQSKVVATPYKLECFATQKKLRSYYQRATWEKKGIGVNLSKAQVSTSLNGLKRKKIFCRLMAS